MIITETRGGKIRARQAEWHLEQANRMPNDMGEVSQVNMRHVHSHHHIGSCTDFP